MSVEDVLSSINNGLVGNPRRLATAYEAAILTVSLGQMALMPDRSVRSAMIKALLAEAGRNPMSVEALTHAAVMAANV